MSGPCGELETEARDRFWSEWPPSITHHGNVRCYFTHAQNALLIRELHYGKGVLYGLWWIDKQTDGEMRRQLMVLCAESLQTADPGNQWEDRLNGKQDRDADCSSIFENGVFSAALCSSLKEEFGITVTV